MTQRIKDILAICYLLIAAVLSLFLLSARQGEVLLSVKSYSVQTKSLSEPLRLVQLSDLHSHVFGEANTLLVEKITAQQPDLIVMTGDMLDSSDSGPEVVCQLIRQLTDVAPVYYCYGNHETTWMESHRTSLTPLLEEAGAAVLDTDYADILCNGQSLRLGGFHGYYRYWGMLRTTGKEDAFADSFENTDRFKLLLNHIPTGWVDWGKIHEVPVDLVLCGHYHGGQIRLPLIGELYAPYVGLFPKYTEGMYVGDTATAILSTGLGSNPGIPRINNLPQIVVIDLIPAP